MHHPFGSSDPPRTLAERLGRLNDNLQALGDRLKASIASIVGGAIADAVSDAVRRLLGGLEPPARPYRDRADDSWDEKDRSWNDDECHPAREQSDRGDRAGNRWHNALRAAVQATLWFLKRLPRRRPFLATVAVALAAGTTGFVAGPTVAAGASVLASVASLVLTADASKLATEFVID